jgi:hypothetical protein
MNREARWRYVCSYVARLEGVCVSQVYPPRGVRRSTKFLVGCLTSAPSVSSFLKCPGFKLNCTAAAQFCASTSYMGSKGPGRVNDSAQWTFRPSNSAETLTARGGSKGLFMWCAHQDIKRKAAVSVAYIHSMRSLNSCLWRRFIGSVAGMI